MPDDKTAAKDDERSATAGVGNQDTFIADAAGLTEGEVRALRDNAGLNKLAGHQANVQAWEASPAGQAWLADESEREKQAKAEDEANEASAKERSAAVEEYEKAVEKGRAAAKKAAKKSS